MLTEERVPRDHVISTQGTELSIQSAAFRTGKLRRRVSKDVRSRIGTRNITVRSHLRR